MPHNKGDNHVSIHIENGEVVKLFKPLGIALTIFKDYVPTRFSSKEEYNGRDVVLLNQWEEGDKNGG